MTVRQHAATPSPLIVDFDDNSLLTPLFGEHDQHLARIEQALNVSMSSRGNRVAISGDEIEAKTARRALEDLYQRVKRGWDVGPGDVDGAVRMAAAQFGAPVEAVAQVTAVQRPAKTLQDHTIRTLRRIITPRSPKQRSYVDALRQSEMVFSVGPAGTGKTYLAVAIGLEMLLSQKVDRLIVTRPAVEAGERLGFLPGTMDEKVDPYMRPMYDALFDMMPADRLQRRREDGDIEVAPLAFMRGRTLANAFVILDEAQNTTPMQMKMFLTRMGENAHMVITGDPSQTDLPAGTRSGLSDALEIVSKIPEIAVVPFATADVVRHPMVARLVKAYDARETRRARTTRDDAAKTD